MLYIITISLALAFFLFSPSGSISQPTNSFTPETVFVIPKWNATINFAFNGNYSEAHIKNDTWVFNNLQINSYTAWFFGGQQQIDQAPIDSIEIGAKNCNITIVALYVTNQTVSQNAFNNSFLSGQRMGQVQYNVTGSGSQSFNFKLSPVFGQNPHIRDIVVLLDDFFNTNTSQGFNQRGEGWDVLSDGTVTVTGATSSATIMCRDYSSKLMDQNLPFYNAHSVLTVSLLLVVGIAAVGLAVYVKTIRKEKRR